MSEQELNNNLNCDSQEETGVKKETNTAMIVWLVVSIVSFVMSLFCFDRSYRYLGKHWIIDASNGGIFWPGIFGCTFCGCRSFPITCNRSVDWFLLL